MKYNSSQTINDILIENQHNDVLLKRNSIVIVSDNFHITDMFDKINDDLRFSKGMTRFDYVDWDGKTRSTLGFVCHVDSDKYTKTVKIWTPKNEMVMLCFTDMNPVQFSDYIQPKENGDEDIF